MKLPCATDKPPCVTGNRVTDKHCRWRYAPHKGEPIMMASEFMAGWCGIGITTAHDTKNKLAKLKVLRQYNNIRRGFLFKPYLEKEV